MQIVIPAGPATDVAPRTTHTPHEEPDATMRLGRALYKYQQAREVSDAAESGLKAALHAERPMVGFLTQAELVGARIALRAIGREIAVATHHPRVRYAVQATAEGAMRVHRAEQQARDAAAALEAAAYAVHQERAGACDADRSREVA